MGNFLSDSVATPYCSYTFSGRLLTALNEPVKRSDEKPPARDLQETQEKTQSVFTKYLLVPLAALVLLPFASLLDFGRTVYRIVTGDVFTYSHAFRDLGVALLTMTFVLPLLKVIPCFVGYRSALFAIDFGNKTEAFEYPLEEKFEQLLQQSSLSHEEIETMELPEGQKTILRIAFGSEEQKKLFREVRETRPFYITTKPYEFALWVAIQTRDFTLFKQAIEQLAFPKAVIVPGDVGVESCNVLALLVKEGSSVSKEATQFFLKGFSFEKTPIVDLFLDGQNKIHEEEMLWMLKCKEEDWEEIKEQFKKHKETLLTFAGFYGWVNIIEYLLERKENPLELIQVEEDSQVGQAIKKKNEALFNKLFKENKLVMRYVDYFKELQPDSYAFKDVSSWDLLKEKCKEMGEKPLTLLISKHDSKKKADLSLVAEVFNLEESKETKEEAFHFAFQCFNHSDFNGFWERHFPEIKSFKELFQFLKGNFSSALSFGYLFSFFKYKDKSFDFSLIVDWIVSEVEEGQQEWVLKCLKQYVKDEDLKNKLQGRQPLLQALFPEPKSR